MNVTQSGRLGSDFMLVNSDNMDDIFNGIEVDIERSELTGFENDKSNDQNSVQLYPNPVNSVLNWNSSLNIDRICVYNIVGILQFQLTQNYANSIDLSHLQSGMYFLQLSKGNQVIHTEKFIKE